MTRKILLADLDAFFASVEQRDKPALQGKPVIVCGYNNRGVVAAASYEARSFGIHSAMPVFQAKKLCPKGYYIVPDFEKYEKASHQVYEIFYNYTDIVEAAGLDEAYLDVTINKKGIPSASWIAQDLRYEVFRETGLTLSVGVAPNKLVAKIACDFNKPNGVTVVTPEQVFDFLKDLPVGKIPGIGPRTEGICWSFNIKKISDFLRFDDETLEQWFGSSGPHFKLCAQGIDNRPLLIGHERKSCGIEDTFGSDILDLGEIYYQLEKLAKKLEKRLESDDVCGRTVVLKAKYFDYRSITRRKTLTNPISDWYSILFCAKNLISQTEIGKTPIRLLGLALTQLQNGSTGPSVIQPLLFE